MYVTIITFCVLALNEARIVLRIVDQNDNSPKFVNDSMPVIAAVSLLTGYGTPVATVQVSFSVHVYTLPNLFIFVYI